MNNVNGRLNSTTAAYIVCGHIIFISCNKKITFIDSFKFDL